MARLARVVAVDIPHHVTQRANARRFILEADSDKLVYLDLLRQYCILYELSVLGYCLMSNHVHLVVTPRRIDSLQLTLKNTHGRYAAYWNASHASSGHAWQGRYYSCPLDLTHLWRALRYTELNPVRARMVSTPEAYRWSSAGAHCGTAQPDLELETHAWEKQWNSITWKEYLSEPNAEAEAEAIRQSTHTGRPLGTPEFIESLEKTTGRVLSAQKGGRPSKQAASTNQQLFSFD
jgi:REP-associated tyrosine transposase